jgi:hypothetical protein
MNGNYNQIVLVGHLPEKLIYSIDKETVHKITLITEKEPLPGTPEAKKILNKLTKYYENRKIPVQIVEFDFHIHTKPIAELIHFIYQQRLQGFDKITVNISGGLRYMVIWLYIACSITSTRIIHGDFIYEGREEVGIYSNMDLPTIHFPLISDKQFEFLELFFSNYDNYHDFFKPELTFNDNLLLVNRRKYNSLEDIKKALENKRDESLTRGSINGYIQKLNKISALNIHPNPKDKKEKTIEISYLGIAHFLNKLIKNYK